MSPLQINIYCKHALPSAPPLQSWKEATGWAFKKWTSFTSRATDSLFESFTYVQNMDSYVVRFPRELSISYYKIPAANCWWVDLIVVLSNVKTP